MDAAWGWIKMQGAVGMDGDESLAVVIAHVIGGFPMAALSLLLEPRPLRLAIEITAIYPSRFTLDIGAGFLAGFFDAVIGRRLVMFTDLSKGLEEWRSGYVVGHEFGTSIHKRPQMNADARGSDDAVARKGGG